MISVRNLTKVYKLGKKSSVKRVVALNGVNIDFPDKGLVFLLGKSGSGKSTLLNSIGGLDTFDSGEIIIKGKSSKDFKQSDFDSYRNTFIGFIFQEYNILEEFTVGKNLALALELQGKKADKEQVEKLLEEVDLAGYYKRKPNQLSGGQKQRVAIARALIKDPEIIMADEPTGALDSATGKQVMDTLKKLSKTKLVIIVSHDREFAEVYGDRIIELKDGNIIRDEVKTEVEAVKSATGVSFIDDKIIHIKKGQHISKDDIVKIANMINDNTNNSDTIISFDTKSNEEVKKAAFITDEGNREVFKTTEEKDVQRQKHDPKDFKMIKSKLKFKDSFKMGASSLKHKPVRLIFTILLAVVAFTMFGVVNTMSSFNRGDSIYSTVKALDVKTIGINKRAELNNYETFLISDKEFNKFQSDNTNYELHKVLASGTNFNVYNAGSSTSDNNSYYTIRRKNISGLMAINDDIKENLKLNLINGALPTGTNEICISSNILDTLIETYDNINSFNDLENINFSIDSINKNFKIVGVLQDDTDLDDYRDLTGDYTSQQKNRTKYEELEIIMNYSLVNMCYISEDMFNECFNNISSYNYNRYTSYVKGQDFNSGSSASFYPSSQDSYTPSYLKEGISVSTLKDNQAIVSAHILTSYFEIPYDEIESRINNGLTVSYGVGYEPHKNHAFSLDVVGYYENGGERITVNDEFYNDYFKGSTNIIVRLKGTTADNKLINYFENKEGSFYFSVQCVSTPVLDTFGSMIDIMADVLLYMGIGLAVFSGFMLMNFISTSISYKKREIGVLRAIGARGKDVFSIFFSESFIICMINFVISAVACGITCSIINNSIISKLGVNLTLMMFGFKQIALLFGIALLVAFVSSFFPVFRFARKNPIDSINNR